MGSAMQVLKILINYFMPVVILVLWVLMALSISNRVVRYIRRKKFEKVLSRTDEILEEANKIINEKKSNY